METTPNIPNDTAGTTAPGPGIVSSTDTRTALATGSSELDTLINTPDPYLTYLENRAGGLITNTSAPSIEEQNIAQQSGRLQEKTVSDFSRYKAGLETLGIQSGLGKYAPELQADRMIQADMAETSAIAEIQDKEDLAMAKAKQARLDNDAETLKATLDEIRQIKQDKADAIQAALNKRTQDITVAKSLAPYALAELSSLPADQQEAFLLQIAKDNNISVLALQAAMADEQYSRSKTGGSGGGYTALELRKLRAAGIDPSNISVADNYLYNKGMAPMEYDRAYLEDTYDKSDLWNLALSLGVERDVNLSKGDEIDTFFETPELVSYTQDMLASGYTIDDIINAQGK